MSRTTTIAGRYRVLSQFDADFPVYAAVDERSGSPCVVKFAGQKPSLRSHGQTREVLRTRLAEEARLLTNWRSCPNVVRLLDAALDCPKPFLVLEQLGETSDHELPEGGLSIPDALEVAIDVANALAAIHALGDAHGDVKPANILRHPGTGRWTLIDPAGTSLHTAVYASPKLSGPGNDVFALARTLVLLLSGREGDELTHEEQEGIAVELGDGRLCRTLDAMALYARARSRRRTQPTAKQALAVFRRARRCAESL